MSLRPAAYEPVEKQLKAIFYEIVFRPVVQVLNRATAQMRGNGALQNSAQSVLSEALRAGRVQYADGVFSGQFSAAISGALRALGARFDRRAGVYRLAPSTVPSWLSAEAGAYRVTAREAHEAIKAALDGTLDHLDDLVETHQVKVITPVGYVEREVQRAAESLGIKAELSPAARARLIENYTQSLKLDIRNFTESAARELRHTVEKNAEKGYRFDQLIDRIEQRYSVSEAKAAFLARQETGLFMSKFRQERFKESGVRRYRWSSSQDERVRDRHAKLNGTIQFYDSPPIVDDLTGRRANPGEDFNCRCVDIPVLEAVVEEAA